MNMLLLVVAKRSELHNGIWKRVTARDVTVIRASTQQKVLNEIAHAAPDFVLLSCHTERVVTRRFVERLRQVAPRAGLIGLAAATSWELAPFVDDLLVEPLMFSDLMASMGRIQQRRGDHYLTIPPLKLDPISRRLWVRDTEFRLTPKQCDLITVFMRHPNEIISRKTLMEVVWDTDYLGDTRTLDVHIHWLRSILKRVDVLPPLLETVRGHGYRLNA